MPTAGQHRKPTVPKEEMEAMRIAKQMYSSLMQKTAPKATPAGYIIGACKVLEVLLKQAAEQGADKENLKLYAIQFIHGL